MFPKLGDSETPQQHRHRRPPPNYSSRKVQIRIMMLVFGVMIVIVVMQEVGNPDFWWFMGFDDDKITEAEKSDGEYRSTVTYDGDDNPILADPAAQAHAEREMADAKSALDRIKHDGWTKALDKITPIERSLLAKVLKAARDGEGLDASDQDAWPTVIRKLDEHWQEYLQVAWDALSRLTDDPADNKAAWLTMLSKVETEWNRQLKPALEAASHPAAASETTKSHLNDFQLLLDELALGRIRDSTMSLDARDRETRYRLLDKLSRMPDDELLDPARVEEARVGILQLARQPKDYRGKIVTIRGTARLASLIQAPSNVYGIEQWYVFWVRPVGGSPQPFTVYTLAVPEGFPEIGSEDTEIDEEVEFTGYFFRNAGYTATDEIRTRPVLLAKAPTWEPKVMDKVELPRPTAIILAIIGVAAVAVFIALVVYKSSTRSPEIVTRFSSNATSQPDSLDALADDDRVVDVDEVLRKLSTEDD